MTPLLYLNKELHTAPDRRGLHEPRKPDLQRIAREARIQARKRLFQPTAAAGTESAMWLEEGLHASTRAIRACMRQTAQFVRRHPLQAATGALVAGLMISMLMRRR